MDKPVVTLVYTRKPKAANKKVPNKLEPNNSWGSSSSNVLSSLLTCRLSKSSSARQGLVRGLPKLKFRKGHLCSACAMGKSTKKTHKPKSKDTNKLLDLSFFHMFGALCYPTNDNENLGKLQPKADIGIFIGYVPTKKAFRIYNRRTRRIVETIHVDFDELTAMASE
nr:integrase, catalytic region, zinc finger, CCHC-type, peptidase aspartic, catalytic [Tanacetum cinerariifolium]